MAAPAWIPGVTKVPSLHDGGTLIDAPPRMTWHTYEAPYTLTAEQGAESLVRAGNEAHFVFHPLGGLVEILPATVAARCLQNRPGGVQTNRLGTVHLQVEVIARASRAWTLDLTDEGRADLQCLIDFGRAHGIPDVWPAGPPPRYFDGIGNRPTPRRSITTWTTKGGHFGHSQVPENDHGDPGAINIRALFTTTTITSSAQEDPMPIYVRPDPGGQPGDGYLAVTPTGVHAVTGAEWEVLKTTPGLEMQALPRARWQALRDIADPPARIDVRQLAGLIADALPPVTAVGGPTAAEIADAVLSRIRLVQRTT